MANFPTSLDTLTNPASGDNLDSPSHSQQHIDANDICEALEAKVGADSSAVTTSHDYKLGEVTGTDKAVGKSATQTLTNKTIHINDNSLTNPYKARAYNDTGQSIPSRTMTKIELSSENYDINGDFDNATNYNYTAPVSGYYAISYAVQLATTATTGTILLLLKKNGTDISRGGRFLIDNIAGITGSDILYLSATDYIELFLYQSSGAAQPLEQPGIDKNFLAIHLLSI